MAQVRDLGSMPLLVRGRYCKGVLVPVAFNLICALLARCWCVHDFSSIIWCATSRPSEQTVQGEVGYFYLRLAYLFQQLVQHELRRIKYEVASARYPRFRPPVQVLSLGNTVNSKTAQRPSQGLVLLEYPQEVVSEVGISVASP